MRVKLLLAAPAIALLTGLLLFHSTSIAQTTKTAVAGPQYDRSGMHEWFWGKHYRKEWAIPVTVPLFYLDTAAGGLTVYKTGGSRQTNTLRLQNVNGKEYVLRSIDKTFGGALDSIYRGTFVERVINDQVSIAHPYSAVTVTPLAEAAKIYHTEPKIVFVPKQPALGDLNEKYGDHLYLFEQRPDENWEEAPNFGYSKNIIGTEKLLENLLEDNNRRVDQPMYVRARLVDMLIGDASRHEDQWRWATFDKDGQTIYRPIPRDRDQAYAQFDGVLVKFILSAANLGYLQTFSDVIPDVRLNNFPARNLDRRMANETTMDQWTSIAKELQAAITDNVIETAVKKLPPEVFAVSGEKMIKSLKSRRDDLLRFATDYYLFLAREVDVAGTEENEFFYIKRVNNDEVMVSITGVDTNGRLKPKAVYERVFKRNETDEIRVYGIDGNDTYLIEGETDNSIMVRLIGGKGKDNIIDKSIVRSGNRTTRVYDDRNNTIQRSGETKLKLSNDESIHDYQYRSFRYNDKGFTPRFFYSYADRLYVGINYKILTHGWRKEPFKASHKFDARYSLSQKAVSFIYEGMLTDQVGKWDLNLYGNYDAIRWTNYFGLGNETLMETDNRNYYRMRSREIHAWVGLSRGIGKKFYIEWGPLFQQVKLIEDPDRFLSKGETHSPTVYEPVNYGGIKLHARLDTRDDQVVATRGWVITADADYIRNLDEPSKDVSHYRLGVQTYIPLFTPRLVAHLRTGGSMMTGDPVFYQYNSVGGSQVLRGYPRDRFRGNTTFYSSNELQYLFNIRSGIFNGKMGILGLYDIGRVWLDGEDSDEWHWGYGGGIMLAPFNKVSVSVYYGFSPEGRQFHLRYSKKF
jgi:hypothetical protein